ncbi:AAA family ATPase [Natrialbaceae archaeon GCM10025810]|uniref:AAA family ATPase n=1 Tax=Halovalidus salilacus TaxID=3075124 RepID=UPI003618A09C
MLVILCGPPATGKTTLARSLRDRLAAHGYEFDSLHSDDFNRRTYERMSERVSEAEGDRNWIFDGTFFRRRHRERFRRLEDHCYVVRVRASLETSLRRNRDRESSIDERGAHVMYAEFEPPRADLTLDTDDLSEKEALDRLEAAVVGWLE